tara:strand:+ start:9671 stop:10000 length:330 start_codon:yes stop_codon:yes gene_type:complete
MTPFEQFLFFYKDEDALEALSECTHIYCDNEVFVCGYMTNSNYISKKSNISLDIPDTWYVVFAAGKLTKLYDHFEKLPYICFYRHLKDKRIRILDYNRFRRMYGQQKKS